jgi:hypothetical protein
VPEEEPGNEETIEDLEAPAAAQANVAGGAQACIEPSCADANTQVELVCAIPTCHATKSNCGWETHAIVIHEL